MGFGGGGQPPTAPTPPGSSLVMCGLNRFSSESSQQTWQEGSPLPQPENAKNPTGKTAVLNPAAAGCRAASSKAAHHQQRLRSTWASRLQAEACLRARAVGSQTCHSEPRVPRRFGKNLFLLRNKNLEGQSNILFAKKEKKTFLMSFIWLHYYYFIFSWQSLML